MFPDFCLQVHPPKQFDVIRLSKFKFIDLKGQKLLVIMETLSLVCENLTSTLGNPTSLKKLLDNNQDATYDRDFTIPQSQTMSTSTKEVQEVEMKPYVAAPVAVYKPEPPKVELTTHMKETDDDNYMPIKALNTFTRDWVIKARVSLKQQRATQKGGQLMKLELIDSLGS